VLYTTSSSASAAFHNRSAAVKAIVNHLLNASPI
jgi:hypothetical protein